MKRVLLKVLLFAAALGVMGWVFWQSVQRTRSAEYTIEPAHLAGWSLAVEPGTGPSAPRLVLRPPRELASTLFRQLFSRLAESFNGPAYPTVPLVLQDEFTRSFAATTTVDQLLAEARHAGLESAAFAPRCMAHRRESAPGVTRQVYFVVFDAPAYQRFREQIGEMAAPGSGYDPAAMAPSLIVAASEPDFHRWLPLRIGSGSDCVAPVTVE